MKCECTKCRRKATWKQKIGNRIINLCEKHHRILRMKVSNKIDIETDVRILEWLLRQPAGFSRATNFCAIRLGVKYRKLWTKQ